MSKGNFQDSTEDDSPVGDVRRVREKLSERFGNDVRRLGEYAREVGEEKGRELGCEIIRKTGVPAKSSGD